jgi:hypothetical protein
MRRFVSLSLGLAVALPATSLADHKPGHGQGGQELSIAATSPIVWGKSTVVSGDLKGQDSGGKVVELQQDPFPYSDAGFAPVTTATTAQNGRYSFTALPTLNTRYRVVAKVSPELTSAVATVLVRLRVSLKVSDSTPAAGSRVRFAGKVCPEHDGRVAHIQRRGSDGVFRTVRRAILTDILGRCSKYERSVRVNRDGTYRVKVKPGDQDHASGISRRVTLDAH